MNGNRRSVFRVAGIAACMFAFAAGASGSAQAADVTSVTGGGFLESEDSFGPRVSHFQVRAELGASGATGHIALQSHGGASRQPDRAQVRVTCLLTVGSVVLVGGTVVNPNASADGLDFTHLILILEEGGQSPDQASFGWFIDFPEATDPCAFTAPHLSSIVLVPLTKGDVAFS